LDTTVLAHVLEWVLAKEDSAVGNVVGLVERGGGLFDQFLFRVVADASGSFDKHSRHWAISLSFQSLQQGRLSPSKGCGTATSARVMRLSSELDRASDEDIPHQLAFLNLPSQFFLTMVLFRFIKTTNEQCFQDSA
jgi:hypothetical protein